MSVVESRKSIFEADPRVLLGIQASTERVLAVLCGVEAWPTWTSTMISVKRLDNGPLVVGSKSTGSAASSAAGRLTGHRVGGKRFCVDHKQAGDSNQGWPFGGAGRGRQQGPVIPGVHRTAGPLMARLYCGLSRRYLAIEAKGLRQRCESRRQNLLT
jgi:hypothetical protein